MGGAKITTLSLISEISNLFAMVLKTPVQLCDGRQKGKMKELMRTAGFMLQRRTDDVCTPWRGTLRRSLLLSTNFPMHRIDVDCYKCDWSTFKHSSPFSHFPSLLLLYRFQSRQNESKLQHCKLQHFRKQPFSIWCNYRETQTMSMQHHQHLMSMHLCIHRLHAQMLHPHIQLNT